MINIVGLSLVELQNHIVSLGIPKFRAKQLMDYLYKRHIFSFDEMLQLPKKLRVELSEIFKISIPHIKEIKHTTNGDTIKLLLELEDKSLVETVLMRQEYGNSICVSSQVGCNMGCVFCASTQNGLYRNLTVGEIVAQGLLLQAQINEDIHSIVVMGAGEPMENYENVIKALRFYHEPESFHIGYRRMTISTCGLIEGIRQLSHEELPITLALSLHAPNEKIRNKIMPISRKYNLHELLDSLVYYFKHTGRKLTFEYILIEGINASLDNARELSHLLEKFNSKMENSGARCNINLIPVNGNEHNDFYKPSLKKIKAFSEILEKAGFSVIVRKEMGDEIKAACGQLKVAYEKKHIKK